MSLMKAIKSAREMGRKSSDAMPLHIKRLKRTITQFCHPDHFGKFYIGKNETKPSPKHANGQHAKFKDTFDFVRLCRTLEASKEKNRGIGSFHFYVNRPDAPWWLLKLDIDLHADRDIGGDSDAPDLAVLLVDREFDGRWDRVWMATSRNGRGFYVYFLVQNPSLLRGTREFMEVEEFVVRLNAYNRYLKMAYMDVPHILNGELRTFRATVDAVKGSPYHVDWNKFLHSSKDGSHWLAIADTAAPLLPPIPKIDNCGTLATMPLTGVLADPTTEANGHETIKRFVAFCAAYRKKAFKASFFFSKLSPVLISSSATENAEERGAVEVRNADHAIPEPPEADRTVPVSAVLISSSVRGGRGGGEEEVRGNDLERMNGCAAALVKRLARPPTKQELLAEYHLLNLNTGTDDDLNRDRLAATAVLWWEANYSPCGLGGFESERHLPLIEDHITSEIRATIKKKNRSDYTNVQMAVAMYCIERSALTRNKRADMQFTCGNDSILATFKKLGIHLADGDEATKKQLSKKKLSAMKQALVLAGLAEALNGGKWRAGKSKCYGLGPRHPDYQKYMELKASFNQAPTAKKSAHQRDAA